MDFHGDYVSPQRSSLLTSAEDEVDGGWIGSFQFFPHVGLEVAPVVLEPVDPCNGATATGIEPSGMPCLIHEGLLSPLVLVHMHLLSALGAFIYLLHVSELDGAPVLVFLSDVSFSGFVGRQ